MKIEITCCDLCSKDISSMRRHGIVLSFGHSRGGWGNRQTPVEFAGLVCQECFDQHMAMGRQALAWMKERKGINSPNVVILKETLPKTTKDNSK